MRPAAELRARRRDQQRGRRDEHHRDAEDLDVVLDLADEVDPVALAQRQRGHEHVRAPLAAEVERPGRAVRLEHVVRIRGAARARAGAV